MKDSLPFAHAVYLFDRGKLASEMLYCEFEALLDGYIPMIDLASSEVKCVFVAIDRDRYVVATVFFLIDFDSDGFANRLWNLPLLQLSEQAARGPDLGAGAIKLACQSQCPIEWHRESLWDPSMTVDNNHFQAIKRAVLNNNLNIDFPLPEEDSLSPPLLIAPTKGVHDDAMRKRLASKIKEHRLRISTLRTQQQEKMQQLKQEMQARLGAKNNTIEELRKCVQEEKDYALQLNGVIKEQQQKLDELRHYFEEKISEFRDQDTAALETLKQHFEARKQAEIDTLTTGFQDQLEQRDVELMYRESQLDGLRDEVQRLQNDRQELLHSSGNQLLERIHRQGINFVTYHPGAGHITIPIDELHEYLDKTEDYVARKCGVSTKAYKIWLQHYQRPQCCAMIAGGTTCGRIIDRVENPIDFLPGESDRCYEHKPSYTNVRFARST